MIRTYVKSIQEAAASILSNTETLSDGELEELLDTNELKQMDTELWDMVEMTQ